MDVGLKSQKSHLGPNPTVATPAARYRAVEEHRDEQDAQRAQRTFASSHRRGPSSERTKLHVKGRRRGMAKNPLGVTHPRTRQICRISACYKAWPTKLFSAMPPRQAKTQGLSSTPVQSRQHGLAYNFVRSEDGPLFWQTLNKYVAALQDRGHVLHFEPGGALRCIERPAGGLTMRRFTAGLAKTLTACGSHRSGTTCGRGSSRRPVWIGLRCSPRRTRTAREACR